MALEPGQRIASYAVLDLLGKGGMGEVYRAHDSKLDRDIAIKVLPPELASEPERVKRFEREAKVIAALDHPNIVTIYSVEETDGLHFITMQLVQGKTLTELIPNKGLSLEKFFELAIPIADAISSAHDHGITHRDLKPANIMVTAEGRVEILDFGLAKLRPQVTADRATQLPLSSLTEQGQIIGTVAYMSPEQAEGRDVDHRSDIFSLGIILYEMVTGERPFNGETPVALMSSIMKDTPTAVRALNPQIPNHLGRVIRQTLAKDPERRFQSAKDLRNELENLRREVSSGETELSAAHSIAGRPYRTRFLGLAVAAVAVLATAAVWGWLRPGDEPPTRWVPMSLTVNDSPRMAFKGSAWQEFRSFDLAPNGSKLVYIAEEPEERTRLRIRTLDDPSIADIALEGTDGAYQPRFSPDGLDIAFMRNGSLWRVSSAGGNLQRLRSVSNPYGAAWLSENEIVVCELGGMLKINATTGLGQPIPMTSETVLPSWLPEPLPDEEWVLVSSYLDIAVVSLRTGERHTLVGGLLTPQARLLPNSRIAYFLPSGQLVVASFDAESHEIGDPVHVRDTRIRQAGAEAHFSVSADGTLVFAKGNKNIHGQLTWVTRDQMETPLLEFEPQSYGVFNLDREGKRLAASVFGSNPQVWIHDLELKTLLIRIPDGFNTFPVWIEGGDAIAFVSRATTSLGHPPIMKASTATNADPTVLVPQGGTPTSWEPITNVMSVTRILQGSQTNDLYFISLENSEAREHRVTDAVEDGGYFSPNGKWIAYSYKELSGRWRVFVDSYPRTKEPVQVAVGGQCPRWSSDGTRIYYMKDGAIWEVERNGSWDVRPTAPKQVLKGPYVLSYGHGFDIATDPDTGEERFLVVKPTDTLGATSTLMWAQNWLATHVEAPLAERRQ